MKVSRKKIKELQLLHKNIYGKSLQIDDATKLGEKLVQLLEAVCLTNDNKN